jgi:hypothetical protein
MKPARKAVAMAAAGALLLVACASGPPAPAWQADARGSVERALDAYLSGNSRVAATEFGRARADVARTGRADLVARVELTRCAAQVASLVLDDCTGFDALRADAAPAERAYADYLAARVSAADVALLPAQHRAVAAAGASAEAAAGALRGIEDPLARLVAAGVLFRSARANPAAMATAVDTASAQGWRRPLLAWLNVQLQRAEKAGDAQEADRLRRRLALVQETN